jgi:flagellar hook-associated protein 3 FlgL
VRVTEGMIYNSTNQSLASNMAGLQDVTEKVSSTRRLNKPSDNPADVRSDLQLRDTIAELNQYLRNIDAASTKADAMDTALGGAGDLLQRANELALQGANGSLSATDRSAIAQEVSQLIEGMVQQSGTKVANGYVFSGFRVDRPPYSVTAPGTVSSYQGDGGVVLARIGPGSTMQINLPGDSVFQPAFDALTQLKTDLESGNPVQPATITLVQTALNGMVAARAQVGARANRLDDAKSSGQSVLTSNQALMSQLEDTDMASAITEMTKRQTTYQATLMVTAKVMQTSLLDYLR